MEKLRASLSDPKFSADRENLIEHLFIGEVLRCLWLEGISTAEALRAEVDSGGYDLVIDCRGVIRHIQLKSSHVSAKTARQSINIRLADKPSGCVVWVIFNDQLRLSRFRWYGGKPGQPMRDIQSHQIGKHTKGNRFGIKTERPNIRVLRKNEFEEVGSVAELVKRLFGDFNTPLAAKAW